MKYLLLVVSYLFILTTYALQVAERYTITKERSFVIDYDHNCFLKDGEPFRYIAGGFHYFRVPSQNWQDRLEKAKALGLNAIQTYIPWNIHEPSPGVYDFEGQNDLIHFIQLCQRNGLLVVLRPGPYIDAEWEYGGFPWWLTKYVKDFRSLKDRNYMMYVKKWLGVLLFKLKPLLYKFGGPIISMQVENEYSNYYACDHEYLQELQHMFETFLGKDNTVLFTTDSHGFECGSIPSLFTTIDFGISSNVQEAFAKLRKVQPRGPLVNSEFYTGWQDFWGQPHSRRSSAKIAAHLDKILSLNASVNLYMFQGGTNFGFMNGNDVYYDDGFVLAPTTYDYDAPLTEAGDPSEKYFALQRVIRKYVKQPLPPLLKNAEKLAYGKVAMRSGMTLYDFLSRQYPKGAPFHSLETPFTMEQINQAYGYLVYRTVLPISLMGEETLFLTGEVHDRSVIFVDGKKEATVNRGAVNVTINKGGELIILVENQGRLCYGSHGMKYLPDPKGLVGDVYVNLKRLEKWEMFPINDTNFQTVKNTDENDDLGHSFGVNISNMFYFTDFVISKVADTYIKMEGWSKGQIFINSFNLGRYWQTQVGPQKTLYVPQTILKVGRNHLAIMELDVAPCGRGTPQKCSVEFLNRPILV